MKVLFTVRRPYLDAIMAGTKCWEVRRATPRWRTLMARFWAEPGPHTGVFMCGRALYRCRLDSAVEADSAEEVLGRVLSDQGRADVGDGAVVAWHLGDAV